MHHWFESPPGRYLLAWEQARFDEAVADIFGYHSLQLGMPLLDGLRTNRMPHQWLALGQEAVAGSIAFLETGNGDGALQRRAVDLLAEPVALPFPEASLDLLVLPHTLELSIDPHAALREVERVLKLGGYLILTVPYDHERTHTIQRVDTSGPDDVHVLPPQYHGGGGHTLAYREYGRDIADLMRGAELFVERVEVDQPDLGITPQSVFVARKERGVALSPARTLRPGSTGPMPFV